MARKTAVMQFYTRQDQGSRWDKFDGRKEVKPGHYTQS